MPVSIPSIDDPAASLTARGSARRQNLIDAALRLLVRDGHHGVTLRTVSQEAHASHGSVNYYFGTRSALMCAAAEHVSHRIALNLQALAPQMEAVADDPDEFAAVLVRHNTQYMILDRSMSMAVYELTLAGARDEDVRGVLVKWGKIHARLTHEAFRKLGASDPEAAHTFVLNALGGLIVSQLAIPRRNFESRILRPALRRLVHSVADRSLD